MIRVCHVVSSLRTGGMERMVCDLMAGLGRQGVESVLFCTDEEGELYNVAPVAGKACGTRRPDRCMIDWRLLFKMIRFVRDHRVSVLHAHNHTPNYYCVLVSFFTGLPVVVTRHGRGYSSFRWIAKTRLLAWRAKKVVLVSEDAKQVAVANYSVPAKKAIVIHNGVDASHFTPDKSRDRVEEFGTVTTLRAKLSIPPDAIAVGSVGRLSPEKNYPLLVRAFSMLVRGLPLSVIGGESEKYNHYLNLSKNRKPITKSPIFLLLVGDGPDRKRVEEEILRQNVGEYCRISGLQADVLPWLHAMNLFCLPSDTEGLSISLLEAGASGLPCVVTGVGGNAEVVEDGVTGFVVPKGDVTVLAQALNQVVSDVEMRVKMGEAIRQRVVESFSREKMVERYLEVYRQASCC